MLYRMAPQWQCSWYLPQTPVSSGQGVLMPLGGDCWWSAMAVDFAVSIGETLLLTGVRETEILIRLSKSAGFSAVEYRISKYGRSFLGSEQSMELESLRQLSGSTEESVALMLSHHIVN